MTDMDKSDERQIEPLLLVEPGGFSPRQALLHGRSKLNIGVARLKIWALYAFLASFLVLMLLLLRTKHPKRAQKQVLFSKTSRNSPLWEQTHVPLTLGVVPKRIHSHNDFQQPSPLLDALAYGAASIEADVWLVDNEAKVGHYLHEITDPTRTLKRLYVDPLLELLDEANRDRNGSYIRGVFETAPSLSLQFLIDFKTDDAAQVLYYAVLRDLEPLLVKGYLTTFDSEAMQRSVVTVVGSGEARLDLIVAQPKRHLFYDAPLHRLATASEEEKSLYVPSVSPMASSSHMAILGSPLALAFPLSWQEEHVCNAVREAHALGLTARVWGTPKWGRKRSWNMIMSCGADWLNVDNLLRGSRF